MFSASFFEVPSPTLQGCDAARAASDPARDPRPRNANSCFTLQRASPISQDEFDEGEKLHFDLALVGMLLHRSTRAMISPSDRLRSALCEIPQGRGTTRCWP